MKLNCYPLPTAGLPLIVRVSGWSLIALSIVISSGVMFLLGVVLVLLSTGRDVLVNGEIQLRYVLFRVSLKSAVEVANLSELGRGRLVKWVSPFLAEPLLMFLSLVVLFTDAPRPVLPALTYWTVLYLEVFLVPTRVLKEKLGIAIVLPVLASLPAVLLLNCPTAFILLLWTMGTLMLLNVGTREVVVVRANEKTFLILCQNAERFMGGDCQWPSG